LEKKNAAHYLKKQPQSLDEKNLRDYDVIVTMDQKVENVVLRRCPDCVVKIIEWDIRDPYFEEQDMENIFSEIENKVKELAGSL
jgi:protein-tyrosine-phosphatase